MHKTELVKKGYKSVDKCSGTTRLQNKGKMMKSTGKIKSYRVVPYGKGYELYVKK